MDLRIAIGRIGGFVAALAVSGAVLSVLPHVLAPGGASVPAIASDVMPWLVVLVIWSELVRRAVPSPGMLATIPADLFRSALRAGGATVLVAQLAYLLTRLAAPPSATVLVMTTVEDVLYTLGILALGALTAFAISRTLIRSSLPARAMFAPARDISLRTRYVVITAGVSFATTAVLLDVLVDFEHTPDATLIGYLLVGTGLVAFATFMAFVIGDDIALREGAAAAAAAERERIARELHDGVAKSVSILALEAATVAGRAPNELRPELARIHRLARMLSEEMRAIVSDVRTAGEPPDFVDAITRVVARHGLAELSLEGDLDEIGTLARFELLRILDEALTNAERHARARRVRARVALSGERVIVEVEDDGIGVGEVDWEALAGSGRYGLIGMRERAGILGGDMSLTKSPLGGTLLRVDVPLIRT